MTDTPADDTPDEAPSTVTTVATASKPPRRTVQVPVWALAGVLGLVLVVGAFFVGRSIAPGSGDSGPSTLAEAVEMTASGEMPVGDFDGRALLQAVSRNADLDLGIIGDLLLGDGGRR